MATIPRQALLVLALGGTLNVCGCADANHTWWGGEKQKSLYERLGGEAAIAAVVDDFVDRASRDARVNFARKGTAHEWQPTPDNVARVRRSLTQFICAHTGGPQKYTGRDMKSLHAGMKITSAEFDALAQDLDASLDRFKITQRNKDDLLKIVASTRKDIVEM